MTDTAEELARKVHSVLSDTGDKIELLSPGARDRIVSAVVPAFQALLAALDRFAEPDLRAKRGADQPDGYAVAWQLLWDATNGLLASVVLLQRGYETECIGATRTVIERVACAVVLFDNPQLIPQFLSSKLTRLGTRSIGPATKVVPHLGPNWGLCSELGSHVGADNVGTGFLELVKHETGQQLHMVIGGRFPAAGSEGHAATDEFLSRLCAIADQLLVQGVEQILFNERRVRCRFKP